MRKQVAQVLELQLSPETWYPFVYSEQCFLDVAPEDQLTGDCFPFWLPHTASPDSPATTGNLSVSVLATKGAHLIISSHVWSVS